MRFLSAIALLAAFSLAGQSHEEADIIAAAEKTFKAMAAHDEAAIRSTMLPDAYLYSVSSQAAPAVLPGREWAKRIAAASGDILERFVSRPSVSIRGRMAQLWGEYEFMRQGKFSHCGVDSVTLFRTSEGWKIAVIAYTMETQGCSGR